jgi:hypothetical protein
MNIQLIDGQLIVTWMRTSKAVHDEILERMKCIRGAEFNKAAGRCWSLPVEQADRLFLAFPKASYDYDAICAVVDAQKRRIAIFGQNLLDTGVKLVVVDGRIIAQGEGVSPLLQQLVDERSEDLAIWLQSQNARKRAQGRQGAFLDGIAVSSIENASTNVSSPSSEDLRKAELLATSLRNAAKNQEREDSMRQQRRRGKVTV